MVACHDKQIQGDVNLWWDTVNLNFTSHTLQFCYTGLNCFRLVTGFLDIPQASVFTGVENNKQGTIQLHLTWNNLRFKNTLFYASMLIDRWTETMKPSPTEIHQLSKCNMIDPGVYFLIIIVIIDQSDDYRTTMPLCMALWFVKEGELTSVHLFTRQDVALKTTQPKLIPDASQ